jgi:DNA-binding protein HU-beta
MTKHELVKAIAEKSNLTQKDSEVVLNSLIDTVGEVLESGDEVKLVGFGTFKVTARNSRIGRNPQTGVSVEIPAKNVPVFKFSPVVKASLN